jgi:hypothetical protein
MIGLMQRVLEMICLIHGMKPSIWKELQLLYFDDIIIQLQYEAGLFLVWLSTEYHVIDIHVVICSKANIW